MRGSIQRVVTGLVLAGLVGLGACSAPRDDYGYGPPEPEGPPAADLDGGPAPVMPEAGMDQRPSADYRPSDIPANLLVTRKVDPNDPSRTILVISNHPIANPAPRRHRARHHARSADLAGAPRPSGRVEAYGQARHAERAPVVTAPARPATASPQVALAPTPNPQAAPLGPVEQSPAPSVAAGSGSANAAEALPAPAAAPTTDAKPGFTVSPAVWGIGALALLAILLLSLFGRGKRKRRTDRTTSRASPPPSSRC